MKGTNGAHLTLHFMIMEWALQGPPRTCYEMTGEFLLGPNRASRYFKFLVKHGYMEQGPKVRHGPAKNSYSRSYIPLVVIRAVEKE